MKKTRLLFLFSLINFIAVLVCIFCLPNYVVFKFDSTFLIGQKASKWLNLILPSIQIIAVLILYMIDIKSQDIVHFYRYIVMFVAISVSTFYIWIMIVLQFGNYEVGDRAVLPVSSIILMTISFFMFAYCQYQSEKPINSISIFGFRWTKNNPILWKATHKRASFNGVFVGLLLMICGIVNDIVFKSNWVYLIAFCIWFVIYYLFTLFYSIRIFRKY